MPASGQILRELNCIHLHEVLEKKLVKEFYALLRKYDMLTEKKKLYESAAHRVNG